MKTKLHLVLACLPFIPWAATADESQAIKGALIFRDDFAATEVSKAWRAVWPGHSIVDCE